MKRLVLLLVWLCATPVMAAEVTDATGRTVTIPDKVERVLPAGPPAAVLLAAIAPSQLLGFPGPVSESARALLAPAASGKDSVPRLTGGGDMADAIKPLRPDLIIDYGNVSQRYVQLAKDTQQKTGIPTLLFDGSLDQIPSVARTLGRILQQPARAEAVAHVAEAILSLPHGATLPGAAPVGAAASHPRVMYARGEDGLLIAAPDTDVTAVFSRLGWQVVAPGGGGTFRRATIDAVRKLDPDIIILANPQARSLLTKEPWASLRAVRALHAYIAPSEPFGWIEEPPSINRLLGVAWLQGADPTTLAALFNAIVYDHVMTPEQLKSVAGTTPSLAR